MSHLPQASISELSDKLEELKVISADLRGFAQRHPGAPYALASLLHEVDLCVHQVTRRIYELREPGPPSAPSKPAEMGAACHRTRVTSEHGAAVVRYCGGWVGPGRSCTSCGSRGVNFHEAESNP